MPTLQSVFPLVSVHREPHCIPGGNLQPRPTLVLAPRPFGNNACAPDFMLPLVQTAPRGLLSSNISFLERILPTSSPQTNNCLQAYQLVQKDVWVSLFHQFVRYNQILNTCHGVSETLRTSYYSNSGKQTFTSGKGSPNFLGVRIALFPPYSHITTGTRGAYKVKRAKILEQVVFYVTVCVRC